MHVSTLNSTFLLLTLTIHGPIKSIATSSQGAVWISVVLAMLTPVLVYSVSELGVVVPFTVAEASEAGAFLLSVPSLDETT